MKLKIGLLNDSFPPMIDGVANTVKSYADILHDTDEPVVITPKYPHVKDDYPYEVYRYHSVPTDKYIGYRSGDPFNPISLKELLSKKFDVLHVHCPFASAVLARTLNRLSGNKIPLVFTYHTKFDVDIEKRIPDMRLQKLIVKFVIKNISRMDDVWVVSKGAGDNLRSLGYKGSYRIMLNGTDFKRGLATLDDMKRIKAKHNINDDELVFLFVGRMMWYKNIGLIIDAMKIVRNSGVKFKCIMVGSGDDLFAIKKYAHDLDLGDNFIFTGPVFEREELRAYYSISDLFLFPSTYDTSGLVVKEAAACNCPSLLIRNSCASEGIEDKVSGFLCDETPESCAEAVISAVSDSSALKAVGVTAGDTVYYSWKDAVNQARKIYMEVIEKKKKKKRGLFRR